MGIPFRGAIASVVPRKGRRMARDRVCPEFALAEFTFMLCELPWAASDHFSALAGRFIGSRSDGPSSDFRWDRFGGLRLGGTEGEPRIGMAMSVVG